MKKVASISQVATISAAIATAVMLVGLFLGGLTLAGRAQAATDGPAYGTTNRIETRSFYGPAKITGSNQTNYTSITTTVNGELIARVAKYNSADVFVGATMNASSGVTVTAQLSADGVNWATAGYEYWNGSAIGTRTYVRSLLTNGAAYMRIPIAGEFLRLQIVSNGTVTPTIRATLRN